MGFDIIGYVEIDQDAIEKAFQEHGWDRDSWDSSQKVVKWYSSLKGLTNLLDYYSWDEEHGLHQLVVTYSVNWIRDDERLMYEEYTRLLEQRHEKPFPLILQGMCWNLSTKEKALEMAKEIKIWLNDEPDYLCFADWLIETSKYCDKYELSY